MVLYEGPTDRGHYFSKLQETINPSLFEVSQLVDANLVLLIQYVGTELM